MLTLVLSNNLLFLYLGWEGVGLCSYLLIGFWYKDPANGRAARKAFIVTRIGDTAMAIGLFLIFLNLGTLNIQTLLERAGQQWPLNSGIAIAASALLLGGAIGKSAQLPLQTWLPDAMAGPTPVSALIHAATMVTAGVYLIARTHTLFELAPPVQYTVAVIGAITLMISALSAIAQTDIKRILAYSTISQVGYMFLALGVGAWPAAIFHFMTHAFFKALLFLGAGAIILSLNHEHNIFKMGGLRKQMPLVFWTFLMGAASLSALPFVTAGFYSKDLILTEAFVSPLSNKWLWAAGLFGAFLTSLYSFRLVFVVFFGDERAQVTRKLRAPISVPLVVLGGLSLLSGFIEMPPFMGGKPFFSDFLSSVFARPAALGTFGAQEATSWVPVTASFISVIGIAVAFVFYLGAPRRLERFAKRMDPIKGFFYSGLGFDFAYDLLFVRPFAFLARTNRNDFMDLFFNFIAWINMIFNRLLSISQTGKLRWYAAMIGGGAAVLIVLVEVI
jgi:NADH-quinone oxidoreductase subunit L